MRLTWSTLPFTAGSLLSDAFAGRSTAVQAVAAVACWAAWAAALLALLLRRPLALTVLRCVAPVAFAGAVWSAGVSDRSSTSLEIVLLVLTAAPVLLAFLPEIGAWLVNGAAYGDESRFPLRAPGAILAGPLLLSWLALVAGVLAGPLLLAAQQWVAGVAALVVGAPAAYVTARALHSLSQRWAVLVPAGIVLKDHVTLREPVLLQRREIVLLHAAPADTDSLDLTARSPGIALEVLLDEKVPMTIVDGSREEHGKSARFLFTPTRPGALLADAARRRIRVG
jgi:hypothetical protein